MPGKVWDEITYQFPNINGATIEVWEWLSYFILHFMIDVITYPIWGWNQSFLVKGAPEVRLKLPVTRLFVPGLAKNNNKENIKSLKYRNLVKAIHRSMWDSPPKWPVIRKAFPWHDAITMTVHCIPWNIDIVCNALGSWYCCSLCLIWYISSPYVLH